jgi:hypothetical protein
VTPGSRRDGNYIGSLQVAAELAGQQTGTVLRDDQGVCPPMISSRYTDDELAARPVGLPRAMERRARSGRPTPRPRTAQRLEGGPLARRVSGRWSPSPSPRASSSAARSLSRNGWGVTLPPRPSSPQPRRRLRERCRPRRAVLLLLDEQCPDSRVIEQPERRCQLLVRCRRAAVRV